MQHLSSLIWDSLSLRFARFAGAGAIATFAQYNVLILLVNFGHVAPPVASALGYIVGALVGYYLNYRYTFHSQKKHAAAMGKFFAIAFVGLNLNTGIMVLATGSLGLHYLLAQILATGLVLILNFIGNQFWTFRE
jgi:putative flippase GtrA